MNRTFWTSMEMARATWASGGAPCRFFRNCEEEHAWRETCEDGSQYDLDPEDYETEEEYEEALEEEKYGWRLTCEDGSEYGLDPEDYETEDEYNDALYEEKCAWREERTDWGKNTA